MKRRVLGLSILFTLSLCTSCSILGPFFDSSHSTSSSSTSDSSSSSGIKEYGFNILAINDTHGRLVTDDGDNGLDRTAATIDYLEERYGEFIKIANGDIFQGKFESNVLYGRPMVDCLNAMEFDAFVIGNHEFDWGLDKIAAYKDGNESNGEFAFPVLNCNIVHKDTKQLLSWTTPYLVKEVDNAKVGIIGAIGPLNNSINASMLKDYEFLDSVTQIYKYSKELREIHNVDRVVVAMHDYDAKRVDTLARMSGTGEIDAIFTAHSHQEIRELYQNRVPVVQGGGNNKKLSYMLFNEASIVYNLSSIRTDSNSEIKAIIDAYVNGEITEKGNEVLGYNEYYKNTGAMAVLLANAMVETFDADVGITNYARTGLDKGDILMKEMYEVFPFDNMIIKATITGERLKAFVQYAGDGIYYNEQFSSSELVDDETYTIAVIDYVYDNGRYDGFFNRSPSVRVEQNVYMRDLMIDYIKENGNI